MQHISWPQFPNGQLWANSLTNVSLRCIFCQLSEYAPVWKYIDFKKNTWHSKKCSDYFRLSSLNLSKNDFEASYVDQHIAAAGAWNSILGFHPLISPEYPSRFMIVLNTSPIELLEKRSQPQTPWSPKWVLHSLKLMAGYSKRKTKLEEKNPH